MTSSDPTAKNLSYEEISDFAASSDPHIRRLIAERTDVQPEILYFLANDSVPDVRLSVALNPNSPPQVFMLLASDENENVRKGLASQFTNLAPDIDDEELSHLWKITHSALSSLARDQVAKVRQAMAEALKGFVTVPQDIINELARDLEAIVSAPVLEFSPVLSDDDLLDIIAQGTASHNLSAISRRSKVSENISDAIVAADDEVAIAELLANESAQIREEVLDTLIDRAPDFEFWHEPLVSRPVLPSGAAQRLALFIAENLLNKLKMRIDIDAESLEEIGKIMQERFGNDVDDGSIHLSGANVFDFLIAPLPMIRATRLAATGSLSTSEIIRDIQENDNLSVLAGLVVLSKISEMVVKRIFKEQNPKAIVALVWKANLPASLIVDIQRRVARLSPDDVIKPIESKAGRSKLKFPLSKKEMEWSLQFFESLVEREF